MPYRTYRAPNAYEFSPLDNLEIKLVENRVPPSLREVAIVLGPVLNEALGCAAPEDVLVSDLCLKPQDTLDCDWPDIRRTARRIIGIEDPI